MKTFLKGLKWLAATVLILVAGFVVFVFARANRTYEAPYPDISASQDSVLIARGKQLFYGPAHCSGCHAPRSEYARLELGEDVLPSGGEDFVLPVGIIHAPNITPDVETGIGAFTDAELARSLRYGVKRNGQALVDFMPFYDISDRDLTALISFLRSIPAVKNKRPEHEWNFLGKAIRALGLIEPMGDGSVPPAPPEDSTAAYGYYLAQNVANCRGCHTKRNMMTGAWTGPDYAGQQAVGVLDDQGKETTDRHIITPNLTPDPETGRMTDWTEELFVQRFREGSTIKGSIMPWGQYKRMTDLELKALYRFFQSLDPVRTPAPIPVGIQDGPPPAD